MSISRIDKTGCCKVSGFIKYSEVEIYLFHLNTVLLWYNTHNAIIL